MKSSAMRYRGIILSLTLILFILFGIWWGGATRSAFAEEAKYSNALDDLKKDETFDRNLYPDNLNDYSLQLITVSESESGELFVHAYNNSAEDERIKIHGHIERKK